MATSTDYATREGTLKLPDIDYDLVDGLTFAVASSISTTAISAGDFVIETTATLDVAGDDAWPASGHVCINGRVYSYDSISGTQFIDCNGPLGDQAAVAISDGETGAQAVPATVVNALIQACRPGMVYQDKDQTGINVSIAPFELFSGTTQCTAYAGGTLALTDNTTNYIYAYNNGGAAAVAKDTTSWANAEATVGDSIIPLAVITTASGAVTAYVDCRPTTGGLVVNRDYWSRAGTEITTLNAGDHLAVTCLAGTAFAIKGSNPSTSGSAYGVWGHASGVTGAQYGVFGSSPSTTANAAGVKGSHTAASGAGHGIAGGTTSSDNAAYGVACIAGGSLAGNYTDFRDSHSMSPMTPPAAGKVRQYVDANQTSHMMAKTSAGLMYWLSGHGITRTVHPGGGPYAVLSTDQYIAVRGNAGDDVQLPAANAVPVGTWYWVKEIQGAAGSMVLPAGADTIDLAPLVALGAFAVYRLVSDGVNNWELV